MPFLGEPVEIPAAHATVRGYEFRPRGDVAVAGLVLALPGSGGGLGPGLSDAPQPFAAAPCRVGHGALYIRLGHELAASGARFTWDYKKSTDKPPATANRVRRQVFWGVVLPFIFTLPPCLYFAWRGGDYYTSCCVYLQNKQSE